jgi:Tol biopolymer transport system component
MAGAEGPVFSPDGSKVAFVSESGDLGPRDTNMQWDVYLRDLSTGRTSLVSANAQGTDAGNGWSSAPVFSPDGTELAFVSTANNLGPPDPTPSGDVYVRDLVAGTTIMVSRNPAGTGSGGGSSREPVFSPNSTMVAFTSDGDQFGVRDPSVGWGDDDVYVHDLTTRRTTLVSHNASGDDGGNERSETPVFSPDGTGLYFVSAASNLGTVDADTYFDIFRYDVASGAIELVTINAAGTASANGSSHTPVVAPRGDSIAFLSDATDLGPADTNHVLDVYVRDMTSGAVSLVSANASGTDSGNGDTQDMAFDATGTRLVFTSAATNLGPTDTNGMRDVYVRDLVTGTTTLASVNAAGDDSGNRSSFAAGFGRNGDLVLFASSSSDLGPTDSNNGHDLYVRDLTTGFTSIVSPKNNEAGEPSGNDHSGPLFTATFNPAGDAIAFSTIAADLAANDRNSDYDIFVASLQR